MSDTTPVGTQVVVNYDVKVKFRAFDTDFGSTTLSSGTMVSRSRPTLPRRSPRGFRRSQRRRVSPRISGALCSMRPWESSR